MKPKNKTIISVPHDYMIAALQGRIALENNLPKDVEFIAAYYNPAAQSFDVVVGSDAFPDTAPGSMLAHLSPVWRMP